MANRAMFLTQGTLVERLVYLQGRFAVGASGAVSGVQGSGIKSITRVQAGTYLVQLQDAYNKFLDFDYDFTDVAGTPVLLSSALTVGNLYVITTLGGATLAQWQAAGVPVGTVPAVGVTFVAAAAGSGSDPSSAVAPLSGTSAASAVAVNIVGDPDTTVKRASPQNQFAPLIGGYFCFVVRLGSTGAVSDPPQGSIFLFSVKLRNSAVKGKGE
jgi:hypothetical protein